MSGTRVPPAVLVSGALLLLAGCHASSAAGADATATTSAPAITVTAGTAAGAAGTAPAAGSSTGQPNTAQIDEVDAALDRIEKELVSDGGR